MQVVFGLGNPGSRYHSTRHNIGFLLLDYLRSENKIPFRSGKGDYLFLKLFLFGEQLLLVKPTTFMNRSGRAVRQVLDYFNLSTEDILIVYDDFHLPYGELRFKSKGSPAGHNGMKSIIENLGTEDFQRLRIGIGNEFKDAANFVLSRFSKAEQEQLPTLIKSASDALMTWIEGGIETAMNRHNKNVFSIE